MMICLNDSGGHVNVNVRLNNPPLMCYDNVGMHISKT